MKLENHNSTCLLLNHLFEKQVRLNPCATALVFENKTLTYTELNNRSNQLANYLIQNDLVKTGDIVKIGIERSIEMIVGILAVLKSGATYLPIDPKSPKERLDYFFRDCHHPVLLTNTKSLNLISMHQTAVTCIRMDSDWPLIEKSGTQNPKIDISSAQAAVILYTSGSTGRPKGVLLSHESLVNRLVWDSENYSHSVDDSVLQHASFTFDFSILEIFMALANGGKLVLACPAFHYESRYLIDLIQKEQITKMGSVPSLLKSYLKFIDFSTCSSLKQVFLGGEILDLQLQQDFFKKSSADLINIYGPTETSISVLHWVCTRDNYDPVVPIGYPIASMRIYLLNEKLEKVADGETGEIYIAGIGTSLGYYNQPELTDERFMPDPFVTTPDNRMYKTGDLGKKLDNGAIQFLGRLDFQVKIRGLRIELTEIEYWLNTHLHITESIVQSNRTADSQTKLAAYIIPKANCVVNLTEIKQFLQSKLPDYMVPSLFIEMQKFPLSTNGKVDRLALPEPEKAQLMSDTNYVPAYNNTQKRLIEIWEKVLKYKPIGITDSFDSLGGDSLAAMEMHYHMEVEFNTKFAISLFAKANHIEMLAKLIDTEKHTFTNTDLIVLNDGIEGRSPLIFVLGVQGNSIEIAKKLCNYIDSSHPFAVVKPFGNANNEVPDSIEECARIYIHAIENQFNSNEYILGGYSMGGLVALEMGLLLQKNAKTIKFTYLIDSFHPCILKMVFTRMKVINMIYYYLSTSCHLDFDRHKELLMFVRRRLKDKYEEFTTNLKMITNQFIAGCLNQTQTESPIKVGDKYVSLSLNYNFKKYETKVLMISAFESSQFVTFIDQLNKKSIEEFRKNITGQFSRYEIVANHATILTEPSIVKVADIINLNCSLTHKG